MASYAADLIESTRRDHSVTELGEQVGIKQLPRKLAAIQRGRKMPTFPELERIVARLNGVSMLELVEAFARDAGVSLEPPRSERARWLLARAATLPQREQARLWRVVEAFLS